MDSEKTLNEIIQQASKLKGPLVEFYRQRNDGFGNLVDQLRVVGYLGQMMVDLANTELAALKLQDEAEKGPEIKVYQ